MTYVVFILMMFNEAFLSIIMVILLFCFKEISSLMIKKPFLKKKKKKSTFAVPDPSLLSVLSE